MFKRFWAENIPYRYYELQMLFSLPFRCYHETSSRPHQMSLKKAQTKPETKDPIHRSTACRAGEEVSAQAVSVHSREGRVLRAAEADRDPGQNLVPEPSSENETSSRISSRTSPDCILAFPCPERCPGRPRHDPAVADGRWATARISPTSFRQRPVGGGVPAFTSGVVFPRGDAAVPVCQLVPGRGPDVPKTEPATTRSRSRIAVFADADAEEKFLWRSRPSKTGFTGLKTGLKIVFGLSISLKSGQCSGCKTCLTGLKSGSKTSFTRLKNLLYLIKKHLSLFYDFFNFREC